MKSGVKASVLFLLGILLGTAVGTGITFRTGMKERLKWKELSDKHLDLFLLMNQWLHTRQKGKNVAEYLMKHNFRTIAVYGMSYAGERLIEDLKGSEVRIAYGIDRNIGGICANTRVVSPDDELEAVDAVVVTAITFFDEIEEQLSAKLDGPIISLEDVLYEV